MSARSWDPNKVYDLSASELKAVEERKQMRSALRHEWQKKVSNPHRGVNGYIFDPAVQRFLSLRANNFEQFKATPKTSAIGMCLVVIPIALASYFMKKEIDTREAKIKSGQVAYKDRQWRFL